MWELLELSKRIPILVSCLVEHNKKNKILKSLKKKMLGKYDGIGRRIEQKEGVTEVPQSWK